MPRRPIDNTKILLTDLQTQILRVKLRTEQVKLRKLEWSTHKSVLPHITPLPGDTDRQVRSPATSEPQLSMVERYDRNDPTLDPKHRELIARAKQMVAESKARLAKLPPCPEN